MIRSVLALVLLAPLLAAQAGSPFIRVDQFGYRPLDRKVAILRDPVVGYDAGATYAPPPTIEIHRSDGVVVWNGAPVAWSGGAVHGQSGDRVWWVDFSSLQAEGQYRVVDPLTGAASETFAIDRDVYAGALHATLRMFLHQRCGSAKAAPHVHPSWNDGACHLGVEQDQDCRSVLNPVPSTSRDLSGGWHDAGDYNKYVNFADDAVHGLLSAHDVAPASWSDAFGLPESGNGIPDILDEIRHELEWMLRMQEPDGSVLHKVSVTDFSAASPPSADGGARRHAPATASATISACGVFARAAHVFSSVPQTTGFAAQLDQAAVAAWSWLVANPAAIPSSYDNAGFVSATAEDSAMWQLSNRIRAAVWLHRRSGAATYRNFVETNVGATSLLQWSWASMYEHQLNEALLEYATHPAATPSVAATIRQTFENSVAGYHLAAASAGTDAYRAWLADADHTWGSNRTKALMGALLLASSDAGWGGAGAADRAEAAAGYLHYLHGVNPTGHCFLTNMTAAGAEGSIDETYHAWFADGTIWDSAAASLHGPPPGYLSGGPNPSYAPDGAYSGPPLTPPQGQPVLKSYLDWNTSWPENSWEISECSITYQAAYIRLLAAFSAAPPPRLGLGMPTLAAGVPATIEVHALPGVPAALVWGLEPGFSPVSAPIWCAAFGIDFPAGPIHLIGIATPDPTGLMSFPIVLPPFLSGVRLLFQASSSGTCPEPLQSAVVERIIG